MITQTKDTVTMSKSHLVNLIIGCFELSGVRAPEHDDLMQVLEQEEGICFDEEDDE